MAGSSRKVICAGCNGFGRVPREFVDKAGEPIGVDDDWTLCTVCGGSGTLDVGDGNEEVAATRVDQR